MAAASDEIKDNSACLRANQLDALYLDNEFNQSLKAQFVRIFKYLPIDFVMRREIEIDYFIKISIFYFSIYKERGLSGDKLQNIQFGAKLSFKQKAFYFLFSIFIPYSMKKWQRYMNDRAYQENSQLLQQIVHCSAHLLVDSFDFVFV